MRFLNSHGNVNHNIFSLKQLINIKGMFYGTSRIEGRMITNLGFAEYIDGITGEEDELTKLMQNLDTAATAFDMDMRTKPRQ